MIDMNALIAQLKAAGGSTESLDQLLASLRTDPALTQQMDAATRRGIERAAAAMQAGDYNAAKAAAEQLMGTPEGAKLTKTVLSMLQQ